MVTTPKVDVHTGIDLLATFINANAEFFGIMIKNKESLIKWLTDTRDEEVLRVAKMYDSLIMQTRHELEDVRTQVEFLGLRLPKEPTVVDSENFVEKQPK